MFSHLVIVLNQILSSQRLHNMNLMSILHT